MSPQLRRSLQTLRAFSPAVAIATTLTLINVGMAYVFEPASMFVFLMLQIWVLCIVWVGAERAERSHRAARIAQRERYMLSLDRLLDQYRAAVPNAHPADLRTLEDLRDSIGRRAV